MEEINPVGYLLSQTMMVFKSQMAQEFKSSNAELTFEQFVILHLVNANCTIIQQDLANHMQKDKSIIVRQVNGLIAKKYITRFTNSEDKRKKNLIMTDAGLEVFKQMKGIANEATQKLLSGVTLQEIETLRKVLGIIIGNGCPDTGTQQCCSIK